MSEIMHQAHKFLQNFCRGNDQNQILLHRNLKVLLHSGNPVSLLLIMFQLHHPSSHTDCGGCYIDRSVS